MIDIINADSYAWLRGQPNNSVDHVITDFVYTEKFPLDELLRITKGNIITFCSPENQPFIPDEYLFWIKTPSTKNYSRKCGRFVEMILVFRQGNVFNKLHWSQMTGVYTDLVIEPEGHQWRKPLSLIERLVRIYTNIGDTILDPFCGSGTTLQACKNLARNSVGIDISPEWVKYCKDRLL